MMWNSPSKQINATAKKLRFSVPYALQRHVIWSVSSPSRVRGIHLEG